MLRKIYSELVVIRKELQAIRYSLEFDRKDPIKESISDGVREAVRSAIRDTDVKVQS